MKVQCAWCRKSMGEIEPLSSSAVSHGICPKCLSEQMSEAKKVAPMKRNTPRKGSPEAYAWARKMKAAREQKAKRNPGAAYHAAEAEQAEAQERRAARGGKVSQAAFQRGKASAHRQSEMKARELKLNPIAVFGNPGSRVQAKVEGVIYNRCIEIRAEKTTHKPGYYRHPFNKKSRVEILALDNGALLIHSKAGERLWGVDNEL